MLARLLHLHSKTHGRLVRLANEANGTVPIGWRSVCRPLS